eukprot:13619152-Alexandrium_andersonii.AAC.1
MRAPRRHHRVPAAPGRPACCAGAAAAAATAAAAGLAEGPAHGSEQTTPINRAAKLGSGARCGRLGPQGPGAAWRGVTGPSRRTVRITVAT